MRRLKQRSVHKLRLQQHQKQAAASLDIGQWWSALQSVQAEMCKGMTEEFRMGLISQVTSAICTSHCTARPAHLLPAMMDDHHTSAHQPTCGGPLPPPPPLPQQQQHQNQQQQHTDCSIVPQQHADPACLALLQPDAAAVATSAAVQDQQEQLNNAADHAATADSHNSDQNPECSAAHKTLHPMMHNQGTGRGNPADYVKPARSATPSSSRRGNEQQITAGSDLQQQQQQQQQEPGIRCAMQQVHSPPQVGWTNCHLCRLLIWRLWVHATVHV